jgi:SsrA-binding protein
MLLAKNRRAFFDFNIEDRYMAGVAFTGHEVKAVKEGKVSFDGSFVQIVGNKPVLLNFYIGPYSKQSQQVSETEARRTRDLLLTKKEVKEIQSALSQKGSTAIPLALVLKHNLIKLELGIARGKKKFDKRTAEREKQIIKDLEENTKEVRRSML